MKELAFATLSSKGQIVIPGAIRKDLKIRTGSKFVVLTDGNNILLKQIEEPDISEFRDLIQESRKAIRNRKIVQSDLGKLIKDVRKKKTRH